MTLLGRFTKSISVAWNDITGKPTIPTDVSDLTDTEGILNVSGDMDIDGGNAISTYINAISIDGGSL